MRVYPDRPQNSHPSLTPHLLTPHAVPLMIVNVLVVLVELIFG
jgi:hypothetical protein